MEWGFSWDDQKFNFATIEPTMSTGYSSGYDVKVWNSGRSLRWRHNLDVYILIVTKSSPDCSPKHYRPPTACVISSPRYPIGISNLTCSK